MRSLGARRRSGPRLESAASASRPAGSGRGRRPLVAVAIVVLALLLLGLAASPPAAAASGILGTGISIPNPISLIDRTTQPAASSRKMGHHD